jgi:predicted RNA binding protein YcfA (HicA-like mRNA interferase family)
MKRRDIERALLAAGCIKVREGANHTVWHCPCGQHMTVVARHADIAEVIVAQIRKQMACLPKGWL